MNCAEFQKRIQSSPGNAGEDASLTDYVQHLQTCPLCKEWDYAKHQGLAKQLEQFSPRVRARLMAINAIRN